MFSLLRHRLALICIAFAALTACGGGSSDPEAATPAATEAATLTCTQPAYPSTGYSQVFKGCDAANVATYYAKDECVRDNATGLIWQGQTAAGTGLRANNQYKTNFDSTIWRQKYTGIKAVFVAPTDAEVDARTNSIGFKNAVNATNLCGSGAWRLPTKDELLGIVKTNPRAPMIDTDWFPNTPQYGYYWSASPTPTFVDDGAWVVYFNYGGASNGLRDNGYTYLVRLVR